jgi:hypothetical protein
MQFYKRFLSLHDYTEQVDLESGDEVRVDPVDGSDPIAITVADPTVMIITAESSDKKYPKYYSSIFASDAVEGQVTEHEISLDEGDKVTVNPDTDNAVEFVIASPGELEIGDVVDVHTDPTTASTIVHPPVISSASAIRMIESISSLLSSSYPELSKQLNSVVSNSSATVSTSAKSPEYDKLVNYIKSEVDEDWEIADHVEKQYKAGKITKQEYDPLYSRFPILSSSSIVSTSANSYDNLADLLEDYQMNVFDGITDDVDAASSFKRLLSDAKRLGFDFKSLQSELDKLKSRWPGDAWSSVSV